MKNLGPNYKNTAKAGDIIKAYHFEPMAGRCDSYLIGRVVSNNLDKGGYFTVRVITNIVNGTEATEEHQYSNIPHQTMHITEYNRIAKLNWGT